MDTQERMDVDQLITSISIARMHTETMLYHLFPHFSNAEADSETLLAIRHEYKHILSALEIIQECMNTIEQKENAWAEMWERHNRTEPAAPDQEEGAAE